jgi:hypothetical protein
VRKAGARVRITGQLIDDYRARISGPTVSMASPEDVFDLQDKVGVGSVAGVIEPALQAAETARSTSRPTNDLTAYDLSSARLCDDLVVEAIRLRRCVLWSRRSRATQVLDPPSPGQQLLFRAPPE